MDFFLDTISSRLETKVIQPYSQSVKTYLMSFRKVDNKIEAGIHFCSGVLITEENVLSTGRCLKKSSLIMYPLYDDVFVQILPENIWTSRRKILIKRIEVHQNYSERRNFDNDIAVVTVSYTLYYIICNTACKL